MPYAVWTATHFGSLGLILLAAAVVGARATARLEFDHPLERTLFSIVAGLGICASALFLLGVAGLLYAPFIVGLTIAAAILGAPALWKSARATLSDTRAAFRRTSRPTRLLIVLAAIVALGYWLLIVAGTQYPPMLWDSIAYHLVLCRTYLAQHRVVSVEAVVFPVLPALNHMLFVWAMALCDDVAAQMVTHALLVLTALGLVSWGIRERMPWLGVAAAAMWLGHPLVLVLGESAYVDVGAAAFVFFGLYASRVFLVANARWWPLAAGLLGVAAGVKSPGLLFLAGAGAIAFEQVLRGRLTIRLFVSGAIAAAVAVIPTYAMVAVHAGNPLWPTSAMHTTGAWRMAALLYWPSWGSVGVSKTFVHFLEIPWLLVAAPAPFLPDLGRRLLPLVAALPIAVVVALFDRSVRWWVGWILLYLLFWFESSQQVRFLVVVMPMIGLAICQAIARVALWLRAPRVVRGLAWIAIVAVSLAAGASITQQEIATKGWPPPVTPGGRQRFLMTALPGYAAALYVNARAVPGERVFNTNAGWLPYYFSVGVHDPHVLLDPHVFPVFDAAADRALLQRFGEERVNWILVITDDQPPAVRERLRTMGAEVWPGFKVDGIFGSAVVIRRTG